MAECAKCGNDLPGENVCMCNCTNCKDTVFNPVLAYCQCSLKNFSVIEVAKAIEQFFCNEDVAEARDLLRHMFLDRLHDLEIKKIATRKSSPNRSCLEANASDVTEAVYSLINSASPVRFATLELSKLPILTPVLATTRSQAEMILMMEKKMQQMEQEIVLHSNQLKQHDASIADMSHSCKLQASERSTMTRQTTKPTSSLEHLTPAHTAGAGVGARPKVPQPVTNTAEMRDLALPAPAEGFGGTGRQNTWANIAAQGQPDEREPWQQQRSERLRLLKQDQAKKEGVRKRKPTPCLQGSANNTVIKAGKGPSRDLWIFNVDKDMSDDTLRSYISEGGSKKQNTVNIRLFEPRYKAGAESKQFRLTISKNDYDYVYQADFWPVDVSVRRYWLSEADKQRKNENGVSKDEISSKDYSRKLSIAAALPTSADVSDSDVISTAK